MSDIHSAFFRMEVEEKLFHLTLSDGTFYWDLVRREIFMILNSKKVNPPQNKKNVLFKNFYKKIINKLTTRYILRKNPKYLFHTFQRNKKHNKPYDNISDHIVDKFKINSVCIENSNHNSISYFKLILLLDTRVPPPQYIYTKSCDEIKRVVSRINLSVQKHYGFKIDCEEIIRYSILFYKQSFNYYNELFKKSKLKFIMGGNDGTHKGLYLAAKKNNISSMELQHGISIGSILWNYPKQIKQLDSKLILPDYFLTFSKIWNNVFSYPSKNIVNIGNNNFFISKTYYSNNILFVSNLKINSKLMKLAKALGEIESNKIIYFKLHPQQYHLKKEISNHFKFINNINVVTNEMSDNEIFKICNHIVGVRSTLLYTALQAGKNIYIYKIFNYNWDHLILKFGELFENVIDLKNKIDKKPKIANKLKTPFFERFNFKVISNIVSKL